MNYDVGHILHDHKTYLLFDDQGLSKEFLPDRASGSCSWSGPWSRRASQRNPDVLLGL